MSLNALCSYFFLKKNAKIIIHSFIQSKIYPEKQKNSTYLFDLVKITMYFYISGEKNTLKVTKKLHFLLKRGI